MASNSLSAGENHAKSLEDVHGSVRVSHAGFWRRLFAFAGPAYMVSVGYMDPGNWATDIAGGSRFGYELLWVLVLSNLMALLLQTLSARMGIVMGRDLAQACREQYSRPVGFVLWVLCECAIAACDLAEVIGTIIGLNLLFGLPMQFGLILTAFDTFVLLAIQKLGMRVMEAFILLLVSTVGLCFVLELFWAGPEWGGVASGLLPTLSPGAPFFFSDREALYVAIGILGATVMPHNLYLHSALVQSRKVERTEEKMREACRYNFYDTLVALNAAFFVNAAILILAAAAFFRYGQVVESIEQAHELLPRFLGASAASSLFAIALLSSGQSSTLTGTLAGQIVMEGFLHFRIQPWLRRFVTRAIAIVPAMITLAVFGASSLQDLLVLSQVILSLQLPFAIVPLLQMTGDKRKMGAFASGTWVKVCGWSAAAIIIGLNSSLVVSQIASWYAGAAEAGTSSVWISVTIVPVAVACAGLLLWIMIEPRLAWRGSTEARKLDVLPESVTAGASAPLFRRVGVAVENKQEDAAALRHASALAKAHGADLVVIHVVDGVGAQWYGEDAGDAESRSDALYVEQLASTLRERGFAARGLLRYGKPSREIIAAVREEGIDVLVLRSHGHGFFADRLFGHTIESIRHAASIPVLAVR